jgi:agmatine deiminase
LELVKKVWVQMVCAVSLEEEVRLLMNDERSQADATRRLREAGAAMERVSFYRIPTVDVWIRDYGPTFITKAEGEESLAFVDWIFNAWGQKYECYAEDDRVAKEIALLLRAPVFEPGMVLEGGSIDVNGCGTCVTTKQCLLNPNRNPDLDQGQIEQALKDHLGVEHLIWLGQGIVGDDTDGHIDDIARFVNATTVVCALEENPKDENYKLLRQNYERLQAAEDQDGRKLTVVPLPMPGQVNYEGSRLPASYANFYIANSLVLVPTYDDPNDGLALGILSDLFPDRKVLGIPCRPLVAGLGAIHCVTQQEPAVAVL